MNKALAVARVLNVLWQNRKAEVALVTAVVSIATEAYHAWH